MTSTATRSHAWAPLYVGSVPFLVAMLAALIVLLVPQGQQATHSTEDFRAERAAMLAAELDRVEAEQGSDCIAMADLAGRIPATLAVSQRTGTNLVSAAVEAVPFNDAAWDDAEAGRTYVRCAFL